MLVEDDRMVRETVTLMLEDEYDIIDAVSAATALATLQSGRSLPVDVILLDCLLPNGNMIAIWSPRTRARFRSC